MSCLGASQVCQRLLYDYSVHYFILRYGSACTRGRKLTSTDNAMTFTFSLYLNHGHVFKDNEIGIGVFLSHLFFHSFGFCALSSELRPAYPRHSSPVGAPRAQKSTSFSCLTKG